MNTSGSLGSMMNTRAPGSTPSLVSTAAKRELSEASWANVNSVRSPSEPSQRNATVDSRPNRHCRSVQAKPILSSRRAEVLTGLVFWTYELGVFFFPANGSSARVAYHRRCG